MASIITKENSEEHSITRYNFQVFSMGDDEEAEIKEDYQPQNQTSQKTPPQEEFFSGKIIDMSNKEDSKPKEQKDDRLESVLKQTENITDQFIKLQMKLEDKEIEYEKKLELATKEAFESGVEAGKKELLDLNGHQKLVDLSAFAMSIENLNSRASSYSEALEDIKSELIVAALDIAKEVVKVEVGESSHKIAKLLCDEIIDDLKTTAKVVLRVNPADHGSISEHVGSLEHIEVLSDRAVTLGGVVAMSESSNIDAQISKRFERVKKVALSD